MSILGNIIWLIFGGFLAGMGYILGGLVLCLTIVGIPFGVQSIKIGIATFAPFGREVQELEQSNSVGNIVFNMIWIILFGWEIALAHLIHGLLLAFERWNGKQPLYGRLPRAIGVALTFVIVLFTWVFFRASNLPAALTYCGNMLGLGELQEGAVLLRGVPYNPYYLGTFFLAAVVTWCCPQTWDWSRVITWPKLVVAILLFWLAIALMTIQAYNPFIYFIF